MEMMGMKTFKWENAKKVIPLTAGGYSGLIFIAYKVDDEFNPGKKCYEYAIAICKHKQKNSEVVIMDVFGGTYYKMWQDVDYWSYIPDAPEVEK